MILTDGPIHKTAEIASKAEERAFWELHDSTDYLDWSKAQRAVPPAPTFREKHPALQSVMTHRAKGIAEIYFP